METGGISESPIELKKTKSKTARKPKENLLKQSKSFILILIYFAFAECLVPDKIGREKRKLFI